jgi:hypothetical protein
MQDCAYTAWIDAFNEGKAAVDAMQTRRSGGVT